MQNLNTHPFPPPLSTPPPVNVAGGGEGVLLSPSYSPPAQPFIRAPGSWQIEALAKFWGEGNTQEQEEGLAGECHLAAG